MVVIANLKPIWIASFPPVPRKLGSPHCAHSHIWKELLCRIGLGWPLTLKDPEERP